MDPRTIQRLLKNEKSGNEAVDSVLISWKGSDTESLVLILWLAKEGADESPVERIDQNNKDVLNCLVAS